MHFIRNRMFFFTDFWLKFEQWRCLPRGRPYNTGEGGKGGGHRFVTKPFKKYRDLYGFALRRGRGGQNLGKLRYVLYGRPPKFKLKSIRISLVTNLIEKSLILVTSWSGMHGPFDKTLGRSNSGSKIFRKFNLKPKIWKNFKPSTRTRTRVWFF